MCMTKRDTCSHVCAKYCGREKNVKIKTVTFVYFFKLKRSDHCNQENFTAVSDKSVVLSLEVPQFTDH